MSREQFCQVVLLPQGAFARFLRADAEARGKLLGRLFDTRRFAEVEKRLAERRRTTEARVREGDATLLADAHRMQQAAGAVHAQLAGSEGRAGRGCGERGPRRRRRRPVPPAAAQCGRRARAVESA
ncbi:hypothetical protein SVIOM342S_06138 [Streptomyces violaceorubidus]